MPGHIIPLTDEELLTVGDDQRLRAKLTREERGRLNRLMAQQAPPEQPPVAPEGSATGRFFSNIGEQLNPVAAVKGIAQAVSSPIETGRALYEGQMQQFDKAGEAYAQGRYSEMLGHGMAGTLPLVGPAAAGAGEQIAAGDIAGGLGAGTGLAASVIGVRPIAKGAVNTARTVTPSRVLDKAATALEKGAVERVADVMSPQVGRMKQRWGNRAAGVAPTLAKELAAEGAPFSRQAFHADMTAKHMEAKRALDAVADERLAARTFETKPMIDGLLEKRQALTSEAVEADAYPRTRQPTGQPYSAVGPVREVSSPLGKDVVPHHNAARVAEIDAAISELRQLGPVARYEPIRRLRQSYDGPAEVVYSPSVTQDFLKNQGGALGAADVTGVLREHLARWDPATATANADYHLRRTADDTLRAVAEVERTRPRVGRQIMARLTGIIAGNASGGPAGAVVGAVGAPLIDSALASGVTTKLKTAAAFQQLANAIRAGNVERAFSLTSMLEDWARFSAHDVRATVAQAGRASERTTSPNESRIRTIAPGSVSR